MACNCWLFNSRVILRSLYNAQSENVPTESLQYQAMLAILWAKPGEQFPATSLEAWKDMFHNAVLAKHRVNIREIINGIAPEYIEPNILEADDNESGDQKRKREGRNKRATSRALKDHEDA